MGVGRGGLEDIYYRRPVKENPSNISQATQIGDFYYIREFQGRSKRTVGPTLFPNNRLTLWAQIKKGTNFFFASFFEGLRRRLFCKVPKISKAVSKEEILFFTTNCCCRRLLLNFIEFSTSDKEEGGRRPMTAWRVEEKGEREVCAIKTGERAISKIFRRISTTKNSLP